MIVGDDDAVVKGIISSNEATVVDNKNKDDSSSSIELRHNNININ